MMDFIGFLLPILIDLVNKNVASSNKRFWISIMICTAIGALVSLLTTALFDSMTLEQVVDSILTQAAIFIASSQITYKAIWEKSEVRDDLGLNAKTN